jgi:hypothetical protein
MKLKGNNSGFTIWISARETSDWATRPGASWPCSTLAGKRIRADYDTNGLLDLAINGRDAGDIDSHEFNALISDFSGGEIYGRPQCLMPGNPCYFVAVGQFR